MRLSNAYRPVDLARLAGVSTSTIRRYEELGFIPAAKRAPSGHRIYGHRHLFALETSRAMCEGYGWMRALTIMRLLHEGRTRSALAMVDSCHAELDRNRLETDETLRAIRSLAQSAPDVAPPLHLRRKAPVPVGEAASRIGVKTSTLHFWEKHGLVSPIRGATSRYRLYDEGQMYRLRVISLMRQAGYGIEDIGAALRESSRANPERALRAVERRRENIERKSLLCAKATAALWKYIQDPP